MTPAPLSPKPLDVGVPTAFVIEATGGLPPYRFEITEGVLPPGLVLSESGQITGTPTTSGTFAFTVRVRDVLVNLDSRTYELVVRSVVTTLSLGLAPNPAVAGQVVVLNATVAVVAWRNPEGPGRVHALPPGCGLRFAGLSDGDAARLSALVDEYSGALPAPA